MLETQRMLRILQPARGAHGYGELGSGLHGQVVPVCRVAHGLPSPPPDELPRPSTA